jgi:hypothetical protein
LILTNNVQSSIKDPTKNKKWPEKKEIKQILWLYPWDEIYFIILTYVFMPCGPQKARIGGEGCKFCNDMQLHIDQKSKVKNSICRTHQSFIHRSNRAISFLLNLLICLVNHEYRMIRQQDTCSSHKKLFCGFIYTAHSLMSFSTKPGSFFLHIFCLP